MAEAWTSRVEEGGGRSCAVPLDSALMYLRCHGGRVLPLYLVSMAPHAAAMLMMVDALAIGSRAGVGEVSVLLTLATIWRWAGLAVAQRRVQMDIRGEAPLSVWRKLPAIVMTRLFSSVGTFWGGLIVVPAFYGVLLSAMATPALLAGEQSSWAALRQLGGWISRSSNRMLRMLTAVSVLGMLLLFSLLFIQALLVHTALPSLLGRSNTEVALTVGSWSWVICLFYGLFLLMDFYWMVAGVFLFYDLQVSRLGTDLRARLRRLEGETA